MKTARWFFLSVLAVALGSEVFAQVPESERTRVTDPDVLESMGFSRYAKNVYRARNLDRVPAETPEDWGSGTHYAALGAHDFDAQSDWFMGEWGFVCAGSCAARATLHFPTGARIEAFRWWAYDAQAERDLFIGVFEHCHPSFGAGEPVITVLAEGETGGSGGHQSGVLTGGGYTVNNRDCYYRARLLFDGTGGGLEFGKLRAQWSRQISPPPGAATFGDVPTSHIFFQHIEALAAAEITGGCGGGNFCPNAPVTRGQMAAFLTIALGLYFP